MGRARRPVPERLATKLHAIRFVMNITQEELVRRLGYKKSPIYPGHISEYERGMREPPLEVLLHYARLAEVTLEMLVDDNLDLPGYLGLTANLLFTRSRYPPPK